MQTPHGIPPSQFLSHRSSVAQKQEHVLTCVGSCSRSVAAPGSFDGANSNSEARAPLVLIECDGALQFRCVGTGRLLAACHSLVCDIV